MFAYHRKWELCYCSSELFHRLKVRDIPFLCQHNQIKCRARSVTAHCSLQLPFSEHPPISFILRATILTEKLGDYMTFKQMYPLFWIYFSLRKERRGKVFRLRQVDLSFKCNTTPAFHITIEITESHKYVKYITAIRTNKHVLLLHVHLQSHIKILIRKIVSVFLATCFGLNPSHNQANCKYRHGNKTMTLF